MNECNRAGRGASGQRFHDWARGCVPVMTGLALSLVILGCRSEQPPADATKTGDAPRAEQAAAVETETVSLERPLSPEERAAEEAFLRMTGEGVRQTELDAAMDTLIAIGPAAVPVLAKGLRAEQTIRREMAATMLASMGAEAAPASDALIAALSDDSAFVRANAATALAQVEGQTAHVLPVFLEFLSGDDQNLRRMMATNLGLIDAADAEPFVEPLTTLLEQDDRDVRLAVVAFLGRVGPDAQAATEQLKSLDTLGDAELQTAVTAALLSIESDAD